MCVSPKRIATFAIAILCYFCLLADPSFARKPSLDKWKPDFNPSSAKYTCIVSNVSHPVLKGVYAGFAIRDELWKRTNGQIYFDYKPFSMLGGEVDVLNQLQMGTIQGMAVSSVAATNLGPRFGLVNLPFLINSFKKVDKFATSGRLFDHFMMAMDHKGIIGLDITGFGNYGWATTAPVKGIEEAKRVKFRIAEAAVNKLLYKAWGFNPVPVPWSGVQHALYSGAITGLDHTPMVCYITKKFKVAKYFTRVNYAQGLFIWIFNKAWLNKLPHRLQLIFKEVVHEICAKIRQETKQQESWAIKEAKIEAGTQFFNLSSAEMDNLIEQSGYIHNDFAPQINRLYSGDKYRPDNYLKEVQKYMNHNLEGEIAQNQPSRIRKKSEKPYTSAHSAYTATDATPPEIFIYSHNASSRIKKRQKKVTIKGKAIDKSGIVEVKVDSKDANIDKDGNFTADIYLAMGENQIVVRAMDRHENVATKSVAITRGNTEVFNVTPKFKTNNLSSSQKRLALVIGNANYAYGGSLKNPVNDAMSIGNALKKLEFTVIKYENCNQKAIKRAINEFGKKLKKFDVGLFFYAGHGVQVEGNNYLIPVDADLENEDDVEYDCVRADRILAKMESAGSKSNIVILDACRDNPFERSWRRGVKGKGLAFMNAPSGSIIAYATSPGNTAADGSGVNGLYTSALLEHINTPNITIEDMFKRVRNTVLMKSGSRQTPWESTSLTGHFYFKKW